MLLFLSGSCAGGWLALRVNLYRGCCSGHEALEQVWMLMFLALCWGFAVFCVDLGESLVLSLQVFVPAMGPRYISAHSSASSPKFQLLKFQTRVSSCQA